MKIGPPIIKVSHFADKRLLLWELRHIVIFVPIIGRAMTNTDTGACLENHHQNIDMNLQDLWR
jgi:hypothetical protein